MLSSVPVGTCPPEFLAVLARPSPAVQTESPAGPGSSSSLSLSSGRAVCTEAVCDGVSASECCVLWGI